jgi:iron complex outermembrane receptor protein
MQGFSVAADSVGGGGGGVTTASIHDIGAAYTLVLLNGRRVAPSNSGTTIDLNSIPLSAIERVEVLTDGASALYGADAIAGVVNFILKKGASPWEVNAKYNSPEKSGGKSNSISISKGFGDYEDDGYSVFVSASHDQQKQLKASQRSFASTSPTRTPARRCSSLTAPRARCRPMPPSATTPSIRRPARRWRKAST